MNVTIEGVLYVDPQTEKPAAYCECCGGELWLPSLRCLKCEMEGRHDPD